MITSEVATATGVRSPRATIERGHEQEPASDAEQPGEEADDQPGEDRPGQAPAPGHTAAREVTRPARLARGQQHADPGGDHDRGEDEQQDVLVEVMVDHATEQGGRDAGGPHDARDAPVDLAAGAREDRDGGGGPHDDERGRDGGGQGEPEAVDEGGDGEDASAAPDQAEQGADDGAEEGRECDHGRSALGGALCELGEALRGGGLAVVAVPGHAGQGGAHGAGVGKGGERQPGADAGGEQAELR